MKLDGFEELIALEALDRNVQDAHLGTHLHTRRRRRLQQSEREEQANKQPRARR